MPRFSYFHNDISPFNRHQADPTIIDVSTVSASVIFVSIDFEILPSIGEPRPFSEGCISILTPTIIHRPQKNRTQTALIRRNNGLVAIRMRKGSEKTPVMTLAEAANRPVCALLKRRSCSIIGANFSIVINWATTITIIIPAAISPCHCMVCETERGGKIARG